MSVRRSNSLAAVGLGASTLALSALLLSAFVPSGLSLSDLAPSGFAVPSDLAASALLAVSGFACWGGAVGVAAGGCACGGAAGCDWSPSAGVVAGWTDVGGEDADCVNSVGCDAGWFCASAINEQPNMADSKHIPKSCCLTKPSSMHNLSAPASSGQKQSLLSPSGDRRDSQRVKTAPIVAALYLSRVRKACRTISYTICVVTVFTDGVKRTMSPVLLALIWTWRRKTAPYPGDFGCMVLRNGP